MTTTNGVMDAISIPRSEITLCEVHVSLGTDGDTANRELRG